jgi:RNA polymerase sigma-70 factor (ECF subfamily)
MGNSGKLRPVDAQSPETLELVERCRAGERDALARFYRTYRADVARNLYRVLGPNRDEVEDVLQEVFIEVFRSIARFRNESKISTWLYRVCVNVALQRLRKRRRRAEVMSDEGPETHDDRTPQRALEARERIAAMYRILDELSPKKRVVFVLHEIEGREPKEIAGIVGAPVLTVRTRLHYARKEFYARAALEPALGDPRAEAEMEAEDGA